MRSITQKRRIVTESARAHTRFENSTLSSLFSTETRDMTTLVNPTTLPDETTRLLPPSTFETTDEKREEEEGKEAQKERTKKTKKKAIRRSP